MKKYIGKDIAQSISKINDAKTSILNRTGNDTNIFNEDKNIEESGKFTKGPNGGVNLNDIIEGIETKDEDKQN